MKTVSLPIEIGLVCALAFVHVGARYGTGVSIGAAAEETPAEIIAVQIRKQGYSCDKPLSAERDPTHSKPDRAAWVLKCENATYRVKLIPDMAAVVERLE